MTFLHNITSMFSKTKRPAPDQALPATVPYLPAKPITSKLVKPLLTVFLAMTGCSFLTFSSINGSFAQTTGTSTGPVAPASRRVTANLVTPSAAFAYYGTGTVHTNGQGHWANYAPEIRALARGLGANRLSADAYATNVGKYVRDNIETEFRFGLGKGARGAVIDQSGTAFDQAELMVKLLRAGGVAASFQVGTVTLTADQFGKWSGLVTSLNEGAQTFTVNANAACRFLADGGVPATVNGASSCAGLSGNLTTVTLAHVWVLANGKWYDPAYKAHQLYAGIDIPAAMGCGNRASSTCGSVAGTAAVQGMFSGQVGGSATISRVNESGLHLKLQSFAVALESALKAKEPQTDLQVVLGGKVIDTVGSPAVGQPPPYTLTVRDVYSDVPDKFRTRVTLGMISLQAERAAPARVGMFADELAGRSIQIYHYGVGWLATWPTTSQPTKLSRGVFVDNKLIFETPLPAPPPGGLLPPVGSYDDNPSIEIEVKFPEPSSAFRGLPLTKYQSQLTNYGTPDSQWPPKDRIAVVISLGNLITTEDPSANSKLVGMHCWDDCGGTNLTDAFQRFRLMQSTSSQILSSISQSAIQPQVTAGIGHIIPNYREASPNSAQTGAIQANVLNLASIATVNSTSLNTSDELPTFRAWSMWQAELETMVLNREVITPVRSTVSNFFATQNRAGKRFFLVQPASFNATLPFLPAASPKAKYTSLSTSGLNLVVTDDYWNGFCNFNDTSPQSQLPSDCRPLGAEYSFDSSRDVPSILGTFKGGASGLSAPSVATSKLSGSVTGGIQTESNYSGAIMLSMPSGLKSGSRDFPYSLDPGLTYSSGRTMIEDYATSATPTSDPDYERHVNYHEIVDSELVPSGKIGGGWTHQFQGAATLTSGTGLDQKNIPVKYLAREIAWAQVAFDLRKDNNLQNIVTTFIGLNWISDNQSFNIASFKLPGKSITFRRLTTGDFESEARDGSQLQQVGSIPWDQSRRRFKFELSDLRLKLNDGSSLTFVPSSFKFEGNTTWGVTETIENAKFLPLSWTFQSGVRIDFDWGTFKANQSDVSDHFFLKTLPTTVKRYLRKVSNNLGAELRFEYENVNVDADRANPPGGNGYVEYSIIEKRLTKITTAANSSVSISRICNPQRLAHFTCEQMAFTRPDGSVMNYDYAPSAIGGDSPQAGDPTYRPRYLLRRWYTPRDQATAVQSIKYDELGRVASVTTRNSNSSTSIDNVYIGGVFSGETERRVDQVNAAGGTSSAYYDSRGQAVRTVNEVGVAARYEYDGLGRVVTAFFEETTGASFKPGCMAAKGSRSNCWRTEYEYDARGNVTKETKYPYAWDGDYWWGQIEVTDAAYSTDFNKPIWVRGPYAPEADEAMKNKRKTSFEYDNRGLLIKMIQPAVYDHRFTTTYRSPISEYEYDTYGRITLEKSPTGQWTRTAYGENGQPIWCQTSTTRSTQPGGLNLRSTATCTAAGDVATATDAKGNVTTFTYDAMRRKATETAPLGVQKRWIYDLDGNVEREGAWDGAAWKDVVSTYSPTGKVLTQTDPAGDQVTFTYDALDRVLIKTDPEGRQVLTCYNAASQVLEEWRGTGLATSQCGQAVSQASASTPQRYIKNQYGGPAGAITASWDPNNNQTTYAYQGNGKKVMTTWPDGKHEYSYSKDNMNEPGESRSMDVSMDREGRWNYIYYDYAKRPYVHYAQETPNSWDNSSYNVFYYDLVGNRTWVGEHYYSNGVLRRAARYEYDNADRLSKEWTNYSYPVDAAGNVTCWVCDVSQVTYEYDANDNRTNMRWYHPDLGTIAKRADYSYDALNRMTDIAFGDWGAANQGSVNYQYDTLGRRTKVTRGNGTSTDYAYENDGDLDWMRHLFQGGASATSANGSWVGIDYAYDKSGRVTLTSATDSRIMGALPTAGTYGAANNLNQVASVPGRAAMIWSDAGNLKTDGKGTTFTHDGRNRLKRAVKGDGTTLDFLYTAEGYRIESIRNASGTTYSGLPAGGTRTRFLLSGSEEVADLDANRNIIRYFVPGPAIDERVAQIEANGAVTYMHTDRQASVVAITDAAGNVVSRRGYGSYGETDGAQLVGTGSHPFGYTGRRWDPDLGIYYYRARWYDPETGTFLQTDPIGSLDYVNLYAYVGLEPGNATDPTGMCGLKPGDPLSRKDQCSGSWSEPFSSASPGQNGAARTGELAIQDHYAEGSGEPYTVDPKTMRMEIALDIGTQIQTSIASGGKMASVYAQALETGEPVAFDFGTKAFTPGVVGAEGPAGRSVGRFAGKVTGTLMVVNGNWGVSGVVTINSDIYSWDQDSKGIGNAVIALGAYLPNTKSDGSLALNNSGTSMVLNYNRQFNYSAWGRKP